MTGSPYDSSFQDSSGLSPSSRGAARTAEQATILCVASLPREPGWARHLCSLGLLGGGLLLGACTPADALRSLTPPEDDRLARRFLADVRAGRYTDAGGLLSRKLPPAEMVKGLRELNALLAASEEKAIEVVGVNVSIHASPGGRTRITTLSYQIEQAAGWLLGTVVLHQDAGATAIASARFDRLPASLQELNRFTFEKKGPVHYAFFAAAIAVLAFVLFTLVVCLRSRIRRKWLWVIVVLVGVGTARLDWSSGAYDLRPVSVQLFGTSAFAAGSHAPWIIGVSIPLGAIVFLVRRRRLLIVGEE